jgi:hypothetical protein
VRTIRRGRPDYAAERAHHVEMANLNLVAEKPSAATVAALLAIETQFGRIADVLEGFFQLAKDDEI